MYAMQSAGIGQPGGGAVVGMSAAGGGPSGPMQFGAGMMGGMMGGGGGVPGGVGAGLGAMNGINGIGAGTMGGVGPQVHPYQQHAMGQQQHQQAMAKMAQMAGANGMMNLSMGAQAGAVPGMANMGPAGNMGPMGIGGMSRRLGMSIPATSAQQQQHASQAHAAHAAASAVNAGQAQPPPTPVSFLDGQLHGSPASTGPSPSPGQQVSQTPQQQPPHPQARMHQPPLGFQPQPAPLPKSGRSPSMSTAGMGLPNLVPGAGNVASSFPFSQPAPSAGQGIGVGAMGMAAGPASHPSHPLDPFGRPQPQPPKGISPTPASATIAASPALSMLGGSQNASGGTPAPGRTTPKPTAAAIRPVSSQPPPATYATMTSFSEAPVPGPNASAIQGSMSALAATQRTYAHPFGENSAAMHPPAHAPTPDVAAGPSNLRGSVAQDGQASATPRLQKAGLEGPSSGQVGTAPGFGPGRPSVDASGRPYAAHDAPPAAAAAMGNPAVRRVTIAANEASTGQEQRAAGAPSSHDRRTFFHTCLYDYFLRHGMAEVAAAFIRTGVAIDLVNPPEGERAAPMASGSGSSPNNASTGTAGSAPGMNAVAGVASEPMPHDRTTSSGSGSAGSNGGDQAASAPRVKDPNNPSAASTSSSPSRSSPPSNRGVAALGAFPGGSTGAYLLSNGVGSMTEVALNSLPRPNLVKEAPEGLLYEWWCVFWDVWRAKKGDPNRPPASPAAQAYASAQVALHPPPRGTPRFGAGMPMSDHGALSRSRREGFIELGEDGKPVSNEALMAERNLQALNAAKQQEAFQRERQLFQSGKLSSAGMPYFGGRRPPPPASVPTPSSSTMFATEGPYAGGQQGVLERQIALNRASG